MNERKKVLIDCDPGIDDSFALFLAIKHLDVVGITTVGGNTGLDHTSRNARYVTELVSREDIPVFAGYDRPMFTDLERAEDIHGSSGFGSLTFSEPKKKLEEEHGVDFIIDTFMKYNDITLVTLGPLTNLAHALLKKPELNKRIPELVCMGGSVTAGNCNSCAEFNIFVDPEAAKIVFDSGISIKMVGLNLCRQNEMTINDATVLRNMPNPVAKTAADLLEFSVRGGRPAQLCDACAMAWLIDPEIITCKLPMHVDIETKGEFTRGMTVCDYRDYINPVPSTDIGRTSHNQSSSGRKNVILAMEFDQNRFKELLFRTMESYGR